MHNVLPSIQNVMLSLLLPQLQHENGGGSTITVSLLSWKTRKNIRKLYCSSWMRKRSKFRLSRHLIHQVEALRRRMKMRRHCCWRYLSGKLIVESVVEARFSVPVDVQAPTSHHTFMVHWYLVKCIRRGSHQSCTVASCLSNLQRVSLFWHNKPASIANAANIFDTKIFFYFAHKWMLVHFFIFYIVKRNSTRCSI